MMIGLRAARTSNALTLGWLPTLLGYSAQGLCKFGFYEIFKVCQCALLLDALGVTVVLQFHADRVAGLRGHADG